MDDARALTTLRSVVTLIDEYAAVYDARWGGVSGRADLNPRLVEPEDEVRRRARLARDVALAMGERGLATQMSEHGNGLYGGHPWQHAREAIVEALGILTQREELAAIVGPTGPQLSAQAMHPAIWNAAATLWDDGHTRQAVQTAGQALESVLQTHAGASVSGEKLAVLFSTTPSTDGSPRLRVRNLDEGTPTWRAVHDGAAALVRGAMLAVRNLVSHPGWPDPQDDEALEMLAVLSYVAHLSDRCDAVNPGP